MTVTARAGTTLKELNADLERHGLTLHNMGDIAEQTLAGAISTGTHGTGGTAAGLAAQVVGLELVTGTGEVLRADADENPDVLDVARVGLGALGILTEVTFRVEPIFVLEAVEQPMSWDEALGDVRRDDRDQRPRRHVLVPAHRPDADQAQHPARHRPVRGPAAARGPGLARRRLPPEHRLRGAHRRRQPGPRRDPADEPVRRRGCSASAPTATSRTGSSPPSGAWCSGRWSTPCPRAAGLDVLREARRALDDSDLAISFPVEIRTAPADDVPLSTAYDRDSFYLAFHTHRDADHRDYFALMEPIMRAHDGRPHWGKVHTRTAADLAPAYPRFDDFLAMRDRLDPDRVFANDHLRRILGD